MKFWYHSPEEVLEPSSAEGPVGKPPEPVTLCPETVHELPVLGGPQDPTGLLSEEMKAQRGEETGPRSQLVAAELGLES